MAAKRKFPDEDFVLKKEESAEETKTVSVTIHDFIKRIDDVEPIDGPVFRIGEKEFCLDIFPEYSPGQIGVFLANVNEENITVSIIFKHESGREKVYKTREIDEDGFESTNFLSHVAYKKWAEDHGDVFKVEAEITLHVGNPEAEPEWETIQRKR